MLRPSWISEFVCTYRPTVPGSNPNHTIYAIIVTFCTVFVIVLRKGRKKRPGLKFQAL